MRYMLSESGFDWGTEVRKLGLACWSNFKWSTRSGLKIAAVTDIIISMLQAAGINSETHVQPAVVSFDQDTDPGSIEEEDPENNEQPDEWYWAGY